MRRWSLALKRPAAWLAILVALTFFLAGPGLALAGGGGDQPEAEGHGVSGAKIKDFAFRTLNFAILFIALFIVLRKPLAKFFSDRRENIRQTLADLESRKAEAEGKLKEIEGKVIALAGEREAILAEYVKQGQEEKEKIIAQAYEMAARIKKQAEISIGMEIAAAKSELMRDIADRATALAEDLIKKNITDEDQTRLVEDFIDKVVRN